MDEACFLSKGKRDLASSNAVFIHKTLVPSQEQNTLFGGEAGGREEGGGGGVGGSEKKIVRP